jgi:hypothetical protein
MRLEGFKKTKIISKPPRTFGIKPRVPIFGGDHVTKKPSRHELEKLRALLSDPSTIKEQN